MYTEDDAAGSKELTEERPGWETEEELIEDHVYDTSVVEEELEDGEPEENLLIFAEEYYPDPLNNGSPFEDDAYEIDFY